jgi:acetate kinase
VSSRERDVVLCINSGSSSLKFSLFAMGDPREPRDSREPHRAEPLALATGTVPRIAIGGGRARLRFGAEVHEQNGEFPDHASALAAAFALLERASAPRPTLVGHRVVHGGRRHVEPARVDAALVESLRALVPLAPLHQPAAIAGIEAVGARMPEVPQVACFDTAFHASMPEEARRLPLPDALDAEGVRRYGFHGLSYEYVLSALGPSAPARIVIAHLGNGSSLVAVRDGRSIDTTMGFTPAGGVLMGTRTGDLDPGVVVYLLREKKLSADALEQLVEREAGLAAIGGTPDMAALLERAPHDPRARLAVSMFGYALRKSIGGLAAALGGVDLLVFTGGIGENAAEVRREACAGLEPFGIAVDAERNARARAASGERAFERAGDGVISADASRALVRVVATNEDVVIARHTHRVVRASAPNGPNLRA